MMLLKYTEAQAAAIVDYANRHNSTEAALHFGDGLTPAAVRGLRNRSRAHTSDAKTKPAEQVIPLVEPDKPPSWEEGSDWAAASSDSENIKNPEQLIKAAGIDMKLWRMDHHQVKTYQGYRRDEQKDLTFQDGKITGRVSDEGKIRLVTMWSVKVWFVRREEAPAEHAIEDLLARMRKEAPRIAVTPARAKGDHLLLPAFSDMHFGRLSLDRSYTLERASAEMARAGEALIGRALTLGMSISEILFPFGSDALNVDNLNNTTTRGTWQEMSANQRDAIVAVCDSYISFICRLTEIAPVHAVLVEGNHDRLGAFWAGQVLQARFWNDKRVTVDTAPGPRKYHQYGVNLIGMEHGDRVKADKLPLLMAQEQPALWAGTKYRLFLRGHFHVERETVVNVQGTGAVQIVTHPAFCPPDEWEKVMGYLGSHRAVEARLFHRERGPAGVFPIFINELDKPIKRVGRAVRLSSVAAEAAR